MALGSSVATGSLASVGAAIQATTMAMNATNAVIVVMSISVPPFVSATLRPRATQASPLLASRLAVWPSGRLAVWPSGRLQLVRHLAVGRSVQTEDLLLLRHAQANGDVDDLEDDP